MTEAHCKLSPSAFKRWAACPGSVAAEAGYPDTSSPAAAEGTLLHEHMELFLSDPLADPYEGLNLDQRDLLQKAIFCITELLKQYPGAEVWTESRVACLAGNVPIWGTSDVVIWHAATRTLIVVDYKFGYHRVLAEDNGQMLIYGIGAINTHNLDPFEVQLVIIQPKDVDWVRKDAIYSADEITEWHEESLLPAAAAAQEPGAPLHPGNEQCRWCKHRAACPALKGDVEGLMNIAPAINPAGDDTAFGIQEGHLLEAVESLERVKAWVAGIEAEVMTRLMAGKPVGDYKLVRGRKGNRRWADEDKALRFMAGRKVPVEHRTVKKAVSPAVAKKLLAGKLTTTKLKNNFEKLISQPPGRLTYAPGDDKRPAVNPADDAKQLMEGATS